METAEAVASLLPKFCSAHHSLALTAALLHDAGKSDDYVMAPGQVNRLSDWGRLVSHKPTVTFWIGEIHRSLKNGLSPAMLKSILPAINPTKAPPELGLRKPMTPEAILLSLADLASGKGDLFARQSARDGGWGMPHPHLGEPGLYTVAGWEVD